MVYGLRFKIKCSGLRAQVLGFTFQVLWCRFKQFKVRSVGDCAKRLWFQNRGLMAKDL
jgi:hypothetical protein